MTEQTTAARPAQTTRGRFGMRLVTCGKFEQRMRRGAIPIAIEIGIAKTDVTLGRQAPQRAVIMQLPETTPTRSRCARPLNSIVVPLGSTITSVPNRNPAPRRRSA